MKPNSRCAQTTPVARAHRMIVALLLLWLPTSVAAEPVPLRQMIELALKHATTGSIAAAEEQRAQANYRELRNSIIPQVTAGAGLGWSYGFPLSLEGAAPSLFNINAQSPLWHFEMHDFLGAARAESAGASLRTKDQRNQVIQDTVLSYAELAKWEQRLARLREVQAEAEKMEAAVMQRVKEGVDSEMDGTKARLSSARVRLRVAEAEGAADVLRERLSKLTGLAAANLQTDPDSLPALPAASDPDAASKAADSSPAVQAAVEHARAQYLRAQGEHKLWMPSFDFAAQYAVLSRFNNFQNYYIPAKQCGIFLCVANTFQQNNATIGVSIRFSFLNAPQKARAEAADAEARKAKKQEEAARNQVSEETLRLQRTVAQMQAARDVAELEYEIAQKGLEAVQTRIDVGTANLHDLDDARSQASERFIALQDVTFELQRSQVGLMRATGDLESWALGSH
jgi:outer membrane protein TolC